MSETIKQEVGHKAPPIRSGSAWAFARAVARLALIAAPVWWAAPAGAAEPGVFEREIWLGTHAPLSGPAAAYSDVAKSARAYFEHVNSQGGIHGRQIRYIIRDDGLRPAEALRVVRELVVRDRVFAVVGGFGDGPHAPVADLLGREGVPDLFPTGGSALWSEPVRPWTVAFQPTYRQEGRALAMIAARDHGGKRVAIFAQSGELGREGARGFRSELKRRLRLVGEIEQPPTEGDFREAVDRLRGSGAQVVALFAPPGAAAGFIIAAERARWHPVYLLPSVATVPRLIRLAKAPALAGSIGLTFLPLPGGDDARLIRHREILSRYAPDLIAGRRTLYGQALAELTVEILRRAGPNPTRAGVIKAAETMKRWNGGGKALLRRATLGAKDHRALDDLRTAVVRGGRWVAGKTWLEVP